MADLSQDSDEWSSFDHIEMKHYVFIAIGEAVAREMNDSRLHKKRYSEF